MLNVKDIVLVHSERHDVSYVLRICAVAALGGVLFGYDTSVISGAIDSIKEHFQLSPAQTGWAVSNVVVGCIIGAFISGWMAHRLGRRLTLFMCAILFTISAVGAALATTFSWFILYRIIGGLAVGVAGAVSPMYMSEVAPKDMRGRALSMEQFAVVGGQLIVFIVNYLIASHSTGQWLSDLGWRWMIGSEVVPCVAFCLAIFFIPESPRWHMLSGQDDKALKTLTRISNEKHARSVMQEIRESFHGTADEAVNLLAIFRNAGARWIIFVGIMIAMLQQLTGVNVMMYYAPMVLRTTAGSMQSALFQTIWIGIASLLGCAIGAWFVDRNGRRPLMMWGSLGMIFGLLVVSWALYTQTPGLLALLGMIIFMVLYGMSWGPITWVLISEIFPNRLRSVGMSLSTTMLWIINFAVSQFFPMVNENVYLRSHFHGAFSMWLFAGFTAFAMWFVLRFVPETKGIALEKVEAVMLGESDPSSATTATWVEIEVSERN